MTYLARAWDHRTILGYVIAAALANIITAATAPADIGPFLVTWGTWLIGCTFILRDLIQRRYGKRTAYAAIGAALALSAVTSALLGDTMLVVLGSACAFLVSESLDTEVFSRLRARFSTRVAISGIVGGAFDSVIFCTIGLGLSGIVPWALIPNVILGQFIVKGALQVLAGAVIRVVESREPVTA